MATIRYNQNGTTYSCWSSTDRVTSPSLCFNDGGTTKYVPLFAVGNGSEGQSGDFYFRVGGLCASYGGTTYRAAVARRYARTVESSVSCYISHSGATGTSTSTQSKTVTKNGTEFFKETVGQGSSTFTKDVTVSYGVTFTGTPSIVIDRCSLVSIGTSSCVIRVSKTLSNTGPYPTTISGYSDIWSVSVTGNISTTVTTYPSEYREAWATGDFGYGVTYPSPPSLWLNWGDVSIWNNSGNGSFHAQCLLGGTVAYGQGTTLSRSFSVGFSGDI